MHRWRSWLAALLVLAVVAPLTTVRSLPHGYAQAVAPQGDEFNQTSFAAPFQVSCAPRAVQPCPDPSGRGTWSVNSESPGYLRIWTQLGSLLGTDDTGSNNARNLALQPFSSDAEWTATTSLLFPNSNSAFTPLGQTAGIIVYQDANNFIFLGRTFTPARQSQLTFVQEVAGADVVSTVDEQGVPSPVYLRLVKSGTLYQAFYSLDNVTFLRIGPPVPAATITQTPIGTGTAFPTATNTPGPSGYTASYASPRLGLFAYGGLNPAITTNAIPADFDWLRIGNSQTPAPVPAPTATNTPIPTATPTVIAQTTATPLPTATSTPTQVPTEVPVPTPTPQPVPTRSFVLGFRYVSLWYPRLREGDVEHIVVQAKERARQGIWVKVYVPRKKKPFAYFQSTNVNGLWAGSFRVPRGSVGKAAVTFRLWYGKKSVSTFKRFQVVRAKKR